MQAGIRCKRKSAACSISGHPLHSPHTRCSGHALYATTLFHHPSFKARRSMPLCLTPPKLRCCAAHQRRTIRSERSMWAVRMAYIHGVYISPVRNIYADLAYQANAGFTSSASQSILTGFLWNLITFTLCSEFCSTNGKISTLRMSVPSLQMQMII